MEISTVSSMIDEYAKWIKSRIEIKKVSETDYIEVTTPFLDRDNDTIQLFVKGTENKKIRLSDGGDTISGLNLIGIDISRGKRKDLVEALLRQNGAELEDSEIVVLTTYENFPVAKNNIIRAILAVNDLYYLAPRIVSSLFKEEVEEFLQKNEIRYSTGFGLMGKSGLYQPFHFLIQSAHREIVLQAIGRPIRQWISLFIMSWNDVAALRGPTATSFGLLNDEHVTIDESLIMAMKSYEIQPFLWSKKETLLAELKG